MREIRLYGSEGGGATALPTPIQGGAGAPAHALSRKDPILNFFTASRVGERGSNASTVAVQSETNSQTLIRSPQPGHRIGGLPWIAYFGATARSTG